MESKKLHQHRVQIISKLLKTQTQNETIAYVNDLLQALKTPQDVKGFRDISQVLAYMIIIDNHK